MKCPKQQDYDNYWDFLVACSDYKSHLFDEFMTSKYLKICIGVIIVSQFIPMPLWVRPFVIGGIFGGFSSIYILIRIFMEG